MMKWGRRKPSSSSPSPASSISKVFPMSWLSKFKQKGSNSSEHKPTKANQKVKPNLASQSMPTPVIWRDNGRFYSGDDDSYWRLSFGEDRLEGEKSRGGLQSVRYDSDDDLEFPLSSCQKCRPVGANVGGREEMWKFNDMVSDIRKLRELPRNVEISPEIEFKVPRRKAAKDQKSRKTSRSVLEERRAGVERQSDKAEEVPTVPEEKEIFELEPTEDYQKATDSDSRKQCYVSYVNAGNSYLKTIEEECAFEALNLQETDLEETDRVPEEKLSSEWLKMKDMKMKELMSKSEKQRKSVCMSRELQRRTMQRGKVRVYSPRTVARIECKIKAIEDMKKAKKMMKKKMKAVEEKTALDSFAVVKSSLDPQQDFRNSMIEMIMEKGLRRSEELEELLACYLTLNADEYHNLIIKVFRQVWFELNQEYFGLEIQNDQSCYG